VDGVAAMAMIEWKSGLIRALEVSHLSLAQALPGDAPGRGKAQNRGALRRGAGRNTIRPVPPDAKARSLVNSETSTPHF
jgi:hypothetical protein